MQIEALAPACIPTVINTPLSKFELMSQTMMFSVLAWLDDYEPEALGYDVLRA